MLQDLATNLSTTLAVASLLFFVAVYIVVTVGVFRTAAEDLEMRARLVLDDETRPAADSDGEQG
jgi:hypothetical protein